MTGGGDPPESCPGVRLIGPSRHSVPQENGVAAGPVTLYSKSPGLLLTALVQVTLNPKPAVALGTPKGQFEPMIGLHPLQLTRLTQYVTGGGGLAPLTEIAQPVMAPTSPPTQS